MTTHKEVKQKKSMNSKSHTRNKMTEGFHLIRLGGGCLAHEMRCGEKVRVNNTRGKDS